MPALEATLSDFEEGVEWAGADDTFAKDIVEILAKEDITVIAIGDTSLSVVRIGGLAICTGREPPGTCER